MRYSKLSKNQKERVDKAVGLALGALIKNPDAFGKGYEAVRAPFQNQRRPSVVELTGEDGILKPRDRARLTNMHRDMVRNSPTRVAQDQQVRVNVVGDCGGKLYANFPEGYGEAADEVMHYINRIWAPHCEFTYGHHFNWLLKTALTSMDSDGNVVLVFDDGFLTGGDGTGMVRAFEGDEIASVEDAAFARIFGNSCTQSQGLVYNKFWQLCGAFVSTSQRGVERFREKDGFITLRRDPLFRTPANWTVIGEERRFNQGRAVSSITAAINLLIDQHEITASEAQAAKINAQLVGQILTDAQSEIDSVPSGFDDASEGEMPETIEFSTKELSSIGAHIDQMPEGMKIELLDTKRPNPNMEAYINLLSGLAGGTRGLARVFSTMQVQNSYAGYRGEQCITAPTFEEKQKMLERDVCDPLVRLAIRRAVKVGEIASQLPDNWEHMLSFTWPKMREINEVDAQNALALKLKNGVTTLHRELAPGEYEAILAEREKEVADFIRVGLVYPGSETVSGQLVSPSSNNE